MISYVWAEDKHGNIGYQGSIPWHLPADLHHFKKLTLNHPIIMGRKTFASLPGILPNRVHIVLTHDQALKEKYQENDKVLIFNELTDFKKWIAQQDQEVVVIGGATLFKEFSDQVDILHRTVIHSEFKGDVQMPKLDYEKFTLMNQQDFKADDKNKYSYSFLDYRRK